jgi:hypothetical protein
MARHRSSLYVVPDAEPTIAVARAQQFDMARQAMAAGRLQGFIEEAHQERSRYLRERLGWIASCVRGMVAKMVRTMTVRSGHAVSEKVQVR